MFLKKPADTASLEAARREAVRVLLELQVGDDKYQSTLESVERLSTLIVNESPEQLSLNTVLQVAGTIGSVLMIVGHERTSVITSKALQFLPKLLK